MKKLALVIAATMSIAAPALACPNSDHDNSQQTVKKDEAPPAKAAPAKTEAPKDTAKAAPAKTDSKDSKDTQKKPDKVSSK